MRELPNTPVSATLSAAAVASSTRATKTPPPASSPGGQRRGASTPTKGLTSLGSRESLLNAPGRSRVADDASARVTDARSNAGAPPPKFALNARPSSAGGGIKVPLTESPQIVSASTASPVTPSSPRAAPLRATELVALLTDAKTRQRTLVVDLRGVAEHTNTRITGSVNVNVPALILRRARKNPGGFSIEAWITNNESAESLKLWIGNNFKVGGPGRRLVVIDDEHGEFAELIAGSGCAVVDGNLRLYPSTSREEDLISVLYLADAFADFEDCPGSGSLVKGDGLEMGEQGAGVPTTLSMPPSREIRAEPVNIAVAPPPPVVAALSVTQRRRDSLREGVLGSSTVSSPGQTLSPNSASGSPGMNPGQVSRKLSMLSVKTNSPTTPSINPTEPRRSIIPDRAANWKSITYTSDDDTTASETSSNAGSHVAAPLSSNDAFSPEIMEPVSQILPRILLGSDAIPTSFNADDQLKRLGVTHVLNMAAEVQSPQVDGVSSRWIRLQDSVEQDVESAIREAISFIDDALASTKDGKVLVHCRAGKSRSATVVLAWMMMREKMTLNQAYSMLRSKRTGVAPNIGFVMALMRIEKSIFGCNTDISMPSN